MVSSIYPPSTTPPPPTRHHRRLLRPPRPCRRLLLRPPASFAPDHRQRLLLRPSPLPATPPPQMPRIRRHCRGIRFRSPRLAYSSSSCPLPTPPLLPAADSSFRGALNPPLPIVGPSITPPMPRLNPSTTPRLHDPHASKRRLSLTQRNSTNPASPTVPMGRFFTKCARGDIWVLAATSDAELLGLAEIISAASLIASHGILQVLGGVLSVT
uniref:Uncharacterized protein n=1 Tax=Oryza glumipatula TaxID=40148 RepID=A0A0E0BHI4_9ORYZ